MIFPYLYTDMSAKHILIVSIMLLNALSARALGQADVTAASDTIRFDDGSWYTGGIADSLFNGYGKMVYADSTVYEGEWRDGLWNGQGLLFYPDGDSYEGQFLNHEFYGYGIYYYADGGVYKGYWANGMYNGAGTMEYADGSSYTGAWKDDKKEGLGVYYDAQNVMLVKGYFVNDRFSYAVNQEPVSEPQNEPVVKDSLYHHKYDMSCGLTYGTGQLFSLHFDYYLTNSFFIGLNTGFDPIEHRIGQPPTAIDDETGLEVTLVGWDWYNDEILSDKTYTSFRIAAECGFSLGWFSIGTSLGIGLRNSVRNCKSLEHNDSYYEPGTLYYRTKLTGVKPDFTLFTDFVISRSVPYVQSCSFRAGWGNLDGVFIGLSAQF